MEQYLVSVAIKKGIYAAAKGLVAFALSAKAVAIEKQLGIRIDPQTFQAGVGTALFTLQHVIHDWLKMKFPNVKWL